MSRVDGVSVDRVVPLSTPYDMHELHRTTNAMVVELLDRVTALETMVTALQTTINSFAAAIAGAVEQAQANPMLKAMLGL